METKILFVCLGNICRSPAADGIMRHIVRERGLGAEVAVDSAGTYAGHTGELPDARMRRAASRRGYELTHRARQIREEDFGKFDMIVVMDDRNYEHVHRLAPSRADAARIFRMREFFSRHPGWDHVPDPYYEGAEGFELVLDMRVQVSFVGKPCRHRGSECETPARKYPGRCFHVPEIP